MYYDLEDSWIYQNLWAILGVLSIILFVVFMVLYFTGDGDNWVYMLLIIVFGVLSITLMISHHKYMEKEGMLNFRYGVRDF